MAMRHNRAFLYLMTAQAVSNLGDWIDLLALFSLVALEWRASSVDMTLIVLCLAVPVVLFGPLAGVLADRLERKTLMMTADLVRAVAVLGLVVCRELWQVYLILLIKGSFEAVFAPAKNGKLKEIVPSERLQQATMISTIIDQTAKILGPVLGGILVGAMGIRAAFIADALTFLLSALVLWGVPGRAAREDGESKARKESFLLALREGLQFVRGVPILLYGMIGFGMVLFVVQLVDSQIMILFRDIRGVSTEAIGLSMGASGLGLIAAAGLLGKRTVKSPFAVMGMGTVGLGLAYAACAAAAEAGQLVWIIVPALFFVGGASIGMVLIPFQTEAQRRTPVSFSGRVFGTVNSVISAGVIAGPLAGAVLVTCLGVKTAFVIAGSALVLLGMLGLWKKNRIERREIHVAESNGGT
jgi:MFS family permease